ncbi:MAG TPA: Hpt domain-containing protein [Pirellulales bacterium]
MNLPFEHDGTLAPIVLIVERDPNTCRLIKYFLHRWGVEADVVEAPEEAVAKCAVRRYDLILLDGALPEAAAPEAALGACREGCLGPVVLLTSAAESGVDLTPPGAAAPFRLVKPVTAERLREVLIRHAIFPEDSIMTHPASEDRSPLRSLLDDDEDMRELIRDYGAALPGRIADLKASIDSNDLARVTKLAHQLKGAGGMYGYPALSQIAALLEQAAKEGHQIDLLQELIAEAGVVVERIQLGLPPE